MPWGQLYCAWITLGVWNNKKLSWWLCLQYPSREGSDQEPLSTSTVVDYQTFGNTKFAGKDFLFSSRAQILTFACSYSNFHFSRWKLLRLFFMTALLFSTRLASFLHKILELPSLLLQISPGWPGPPGRGRRIRMLEILVMNTYSRHFLTNWDRGLVEARLLWPKLAELLDVHDVERSGVTEDLDPSLEHRDHQGISREDHGIELGPLVSNKVQFYCCRKFQI